MAAPGQLVLLICCSLALAAWAQGGGEGGGSKDAASTVSALLVNPAALKRLTEEVAGHLEAGRPAVARPVQKLALEVSRQLRGEGSAEHVAALEALAALDQGQGHHLVAATLYEEALALRRARDGEGHFATLTLMHNVAYAYQLHGDQARAIAAYKDVVARWQAGSTGGGAARMHAAEAVSQLNLAALYQQGGRWEEGLEAAMRAVKIREAELGASHGETLAALQGLAALYQSSGDAQRAIDLYRRVLGALKGRAGAGAGEGETLYVKVLETAARLMLSEGRYDEARVLLTELRDRAAAGGGGGAAAAATWQNLLDTLEGPDAVHMRPDFGGPGGLRLGGDNPGGEGEERASGAVGRGGRDEL